MSDPVVTAEPVQSKPVFRDVADADTPKTLKFSKTFHFEYTSPEDGKLYAGQFRCQRPNIGAVGQLGVIKARLNGGERVGAAIDFLHEMLAYLQVTLTETPEWWTPEEFFDAHLLRQMYDYVRHWEDNFRGGGVA